MSLHCQNPECGKTLPPPKAPGRPPKWCSGRCRKRTCYGGTCKHCGALTNGYDGIGSASDTCGDCATRLLHELRLWTPETIIEAIQEWERVYGFVPTATDWNPPLARNRHARNADEVEARFHEGKVIVTYAATVLREFGTWNAAIRAAGFTPNEPGCYGRLGESVTSEQVAPLYEQGLSQYAIAAQLACSVGVVRNRLREAGVAVRSPSEAQRLRRNREQVAA